MLFKLHEKRIPKIVNSFWFHSNLNLWLKVSPLNFLLPIHTAFVFELFILRPDNDAKSPRVFIVSTRDFSCPSNNIVVSSTNGDRLYSTPPIFIPWMSSLLFNINAKFLHKGGICRVTMGLPAYTLFVQEIILTKKPLCITADEIFL